MSFVSKCVFFADPDRIAGGLRRSEVQPALASRIGQGRYATVILVHSAVEADIGDARLFGSFGQKLADLNCSGLIAAGTSRPADGLFRRAGRHQCPPLDIVDNLCVDVLVAAKHRQPGATSGPDPVPHPIGAANPLLRYPFSQFHELTPYCCNLTIYPRADR